MVAALCLMPGQTREARAVLSAGLRLTPDDAELRAALASTHLFVPRPNPRLAMELLQDAAESGSTSHKVHGNLGIAALMLDRPGEAIRHLERAMELAPNDQVWGPVLESARRQLRAGAPQ